MNGFGMVLRKKVDKLSDLIIWKKREKEEQPRPENRTDSRDSDTGNADPKTPDADNASEKAQAEKTQ
jgi:hypothetical protein